MQGNVDQNNSEYGRVSRSVLSNLPCKSAIPRNLSLCNLPSTMPEKIQKKSGGRDWRYAFLKKPLEFLGCYFTYGNSGHIKVSPLEIIQNYVTPFGNFKAKNDDT